MAGKRVTIDANGHWHLDKKVPLGLVVAILVQGAGLLLWGAGVSNDVKALQQSIATLQAQYQRDLGDIKTALSSIPPQREKVATLETQMSELAKGVDRIERTLDRVLYPGSRVRESDVAAPARRLK